MTFEGDDREKFAAFLLRMRAAGIVARDLIAAFEAIPRRNFVPLQWHAEAWSDRMLPIACGEAIEGMDFQARVLNALDLSPGHRVLEIGTGSGYTAALLGRLSARVLSVDRYATLVREAAQRLESLGIANVFVRQADGSGGMAAEGPFDRIVAWAAFDALPRGIVDQLSTGGVMVAPIGGAEEVQAMARLMRVGSRFEREDFAIARLQPLARGVAKAI